MNRRKNNALPKLFAVAAATIAMGQFAQAEEKWSGYLDAGFDVSGPAGAPRVIRGGQVRFSSTSGNSMFQFDMPFAPIENDSTDMKLAFNTAQAFVKHSYGSGISWMLGQFDGIFGRERNDTVDLFFANQGALYGTQPVVNTGLGVGYELSKSMNVTAYASGANNAGTRGLGDRPEFGAKLNADLGVALGVGGYFQKLNDDTNMMYVNLTAGYSVAGIDLGAEVTYKKAGDADAGMGYSLAGTTKVWGDLEGGVRVQMLSKFGNHQDLEATAGVRHMMDKNLAVKVNYVYDSATATDGADAVVDHSGVVAAVYGF